MDNVNIPSENILIDKEYKLALSLNLLFGELEQELRSAYSKYTPIHSMHEGHSLILEEVDEFWEHVMIKQSLREHPKVHKELIQVAAMALRTILDVVDPGVRN